MADPSSEALVRHTRESYGATWRADLLEQYKLYVDSANRVSDRRASTNNYLLTVSAGLVTLYGLGARSGSPVAWQVVVPVGGVAICLVWWQLVVSYRQLNGVKFKVIHELEQHLPAELFRHEWRLAEQGRGKTYIPFTHLEWAVPFIFAALYLVLALASCARRAGSPDGDARDAESRPAASAPSEPGETPR